MTEPCDLSATELRRLIGARALSPVELLDSCLARIARVNPAVNAVVTLDADRARAAAREAEAAVMRGDALGALHGLPIAIKDTEDTAGLRTTYGSPLFADHVPERDLGVVARVRAAGAIVLGKTNTPEWAAGGNTRNTVHGATGNPFDPRARRRAPPAALPWPWPAAWCRSPRAPIPAAPCATRPRYNGIVGLRPSPGLVPNEKRAFGWFSLSVNGPMAREVGDTALLLSAMAGDDARDPLAYTLPGEPVRGRPERYAPPPEVRLETLCVAFTEDFGFAPTEAHIRRVFRARVAALAPLFGRVAEATPDCDGADDSFAVLRASLFLSNHIKTYRERPEMLGSNIRANVEEGLRYDLEDYGRAAAAQTRIYRSFVEFFTGFDVLISPTITLSPRPWRELYPAEIDGVATRSYFHWLALAYAVTLAGNPAISIPLGVDEAGLPFGLQIVGPRGGDAFVLGVAAALEAACADDPALRRPMPDLDRLAASTPIAEMPGFRDPD